MEQVPEMRGLQSLALVIQHGQVPKNLSLAGAQKIMDRCQQLQVLDIVPLVGLGQTYRRSKSGIAYRTHAILSPPSYQDLWF